MPVVKKIETLSCIERRGLATRPVLLLDSWLGNRADVFGRFRVYRAQYTSSLRRLLVFNRVASSRSRSLRREWWRIYRREKRNVLYDFFTFLLCNFYYINIIAYRTGSWSILYIYLCFAFKMRFHILFSKQRDALGYHNAHFVVIINSIIWPWYCYKLIIIIDSRLWQYRQSWFVILD